MGARGAGVTWPLSRTQGIYDWARDKDDRARDKDEQTGLRENAHLHREGWPARGLSGGLWNNIWSFILRL